MSEVLKITNPRAESDKEPNIEQIKYLDKSNNSTQLENNRVGAQFTPPFTLNIINESEEETEMSDDEIEQPDQDKFEISSDQILHLSSIINKARGIKGPAASIQPTSDNSLQSWKPFCLPPHDAHCSKQRQIYRDAKIMEPIKVSRIPVEISIFGTKFHGIIDSGSERSFLSESAYNCVKEFQIQELTPDTSSRAGVRLGDQSVVKTLGGTSFVIDVGDVYGPQWLSILPGLSGDLILGMDF